MRDRGDVGTLREQSALVDSETPIFVKIGNAWHRVVRSWPDTSMAPCGRGLYLEAEEKPMRLT